MNRNAALAGIGFDRFFVGRIAVFIVTVVNNRCHFDVWNTGQLLYVGQMQSNDFAGPHA